MNCRDLRTLKVDFGRFAGLAPHLPRDCPCVAESGVESAGQAARVAALGYDVALVGTALMRAADPGQLAGELLRRAGRRPRIASQEAGGSVLREDLWPAHAATRSQRRVSAGADAVGFVFAESPRQVTPKQAGSCARGVPVIVRVAVMRHPSAAHWRARGVRLRAGLAADRCR